MDMDALQLRRFYHSKIGRIVRRALKHKINTLWAGAHDQTILGLGYAAPYLGSFQDRNTVIVASNDVMGPSCWQSKLGNANVETLIDPQYLPFHHEVIDKAILCHHLEYVDKIKDHLHELWHVLKPEAKAIIIVPNRHGLWAKAEWSPFGYGTPFSESQILYYLTECGFVIEDHYKDLFVPPVQSGLAFRALQAMGW